MADFTWCLIALSWGHTIEDTAAKLVEASEKAQERVRLKDEGILGSTTENAAMTARRNQRGRD